MYSRYTKTLRKVTFDGALNVRNDIHTECTNLHMSYISLYRLQIDYIRDSNKVSCTEERNIGRKRKP